MAGARPQKELAGTAPVTATRAAAPSTTTASRLADLLLPGVMVELVS
jgi:hypothetical protein